MVLLLSFYRGYPRLGFKDNTILSACTGREWPFPLVTGPSAPVREYVEGPFAADGLV